MIRPITPAKNKFLFKKKQTFPKRHVGIIDFFCILLRASQCNHYTRKPNKSSLEWCYPRKQRQPSQASIDLPAPLKATGSPFIWIVTGYSFLLLFVLDFLLSIVFVRCFKCKQTTPLECLTNIVRSFCVACRSGPSHCPGDSFVFVFV